MPSTVAGSKNKPGSISGSLTIPISLALRATAGALSHLSCRIRISDLVTVSTGLCERPIRLRGCDSAQAGSIVCSPLRGLCDLLFVGAIESCRRVPDRESVDGTTPVVRGRAVERRAWRRQPSPWNSLSIASLWARGPGTSPKPAMYCHLLPFVPARPLLLFQRELHFLPFVGVPHAASLGRELERPDERHRADQTLPARSGPVVEIIYERDARAVETTCWLAASTAWSRNAWENVASFMQSLVGAR